MTRRNRDSAVDRRHDNPERADTSVLDAFDREPDTPAPGIDRQEDDDFLLDERGRRLPRSTAAILAALVTVGLLLGGMQIQKQFGESSTTAASGAGALPQGLGDPGSGQMPGGAGAGSTGESAGGAAEGFTGADATETPATAVIGTVVAATGRTLTVKDIGGTNHTVTVGPSTTVERQQSLDLDQLERGESVTVEGRSRNNGDVRATSITAR